MEVKKVEGTIHELGKEVNKKVRLLESMMFPHSLSINHVHTYAYTHTHTNCHIQTHIHIHVHVNTHIRKKKLEGSMLE